MKILLTGANGYIGKRILPILVAEGHQIIANVRDKSRLDIKPSYQNQVTLFEQDFLKPIQWDQVSLDFDIAFFLVHSMGAVIKDFEEKEAAIAHAFVKLVEASNARQIIYLTGIVNEEEKLSSHLRSRFHVEKILANSRVPLTSIRAGIIVGSGSASFEIIRDLVEKLPVMVAPKWLDSKCQPIGVRNILQILIGVMGKEAYYNQSFDVSCGEILTYKQMLEG